ncbi:hypothetical protein B0H11DRAFT_2215727 [Mycena galericulata]|nr:hypothetical protein B0H11DRAFT_2215727 [Mycena galericulata]
MARTPLRPSRALSTPLVNLDLFTGDVPWPHPIIEECLRLIPTPSSLPLRGAENTFQDDFIPSSPTFPARCELLVAMLRVRRMRADAVKPRAFALRFKGKFYFGDYHPFKGIEADMDICDAVAADGVALEAFEFFF